MDKNNELIVSIVKDRNFSFPNTPRPYNNLATYGGESKLNISYNIAIKNKNPKKLFNTGKYGGECFDKNREIQVNITRDYKWKSRYY
jgi:hypothetical protein